MYPPKEDSFFLSEELKKHLKSKNKKIKILDMGTGSGIQAETCFGLGFKNILCCDIDRESITHAKKLGFKAIKSNLFNSIKTRFDLIIFNPPYLPEHKYDREKDTTGGKSGDETILRFLKQAKKHLNKNGEILLLISSLTPTDRIAEELEKYNHKIIAEKNIFFEKLKILLLS